jgi:hypothetical protein
MWRGQCGCAAAGWAKTARLTPGELVVQAAPALGAHDRLELLAAA